MQIPPPTGGAEFENIVQDALRIRWGRQDLQLNGRSGQAQHGVDIFGIDDYGQAAGVQCKKRSGMLTIKEVEAETLEAEKFQPPLNVLYFATTQVLDAPLQQAVRLFSQERVKQGQFPVMLLFWDDIIKSLVVNPHVLRVHYPMLAGGRAGDEYKLFSLFELVFYGKTLDHWANIIFGEWGLTAGVDQLNIFRYCALIRAAGGQILGEAERERLETSLACYEELVRDILSLARARHQAEQEAEERQDSQAVGDKQKAHRRWQQAGRVHEEKVKQLWQATEVEARRLASDLDLLRATLTGRSLAVFELAILLAGWELLEFNDNRPYEEEETGAFSADRQQKLRSLVKVVAPAADAAVEARLTAYNRDRFARSNIAESVFNSVHDVLVLDEIHLI